MGGCFFKSAESREQKVARENFRVNICLVLTVVKKINFNCPFDFKDFACEININCGKSLSVKKFKTVFYGFASLHRTEWIHANKD